MTTDKTKIVKDYTRDSLFSDISTKTLKDRYLKKGENSPQDGLARASAAFADDEAHAQRLYDASSKHWFMFSTPILANGGTENGLGISCFLQNVEDSIKGLTHHYTESTFLTVNGGGLGGYWGNVRTGGKSNGMIPFLKVMDSLIAASNQTDTRRGAYAAYLDDNHPDIEEFVEIRDPNSGDHSRRCLAMGFHHAVNISDAFMNAVDKGLDWNLIDPHSKQIKKTIKARDLWIKILNMRRKLGEPYLMFVDTANIYLPSVLRKKGLRVSQSNLCNEIYLPTGIDQNGKNRTAICCLSSLNVAKFDEWRDHAPQLIEDLVRMLDNVIDHFIENAPPEAHQAVYSATRTRDLGLGTMGFHHYLQSKMVAFESAEAGELNNIIYYTISKHAWAASRKLGEEKGFYPDAYEEFERPVQAGDTFVIVRPEGVFAKDRRVIHRQRNAHVTAIAPNASSAIICGNTSPSVEPYSANAFKQGTTSGAFFTTNPVLEKLLTQKGQNSTEVWDSIVAHEGSVQHLDFLTDHEKLVFKTAFELDQNWIIEHAGLRQSYIDQGQSINLFFTADATPKEIHEVHMSAWKKQLKGLYYVRSKALRSNERLSIIKSRETVNPDQVSCLACEG